MPVATVDSNAWDRRELKSLEGAYIYVRPLPYGMVLERRDKATRMFMESESTANKKKTNRDVNSTSRMEVEMLTKFSAMYDFRYCIGEHNLTDKNEQPLDLSNRMVFESLDPRVGMEIERILDEINNIEDAFDDEDFTPLPESSSKIPIDLMTSEAPS